MKTSILSLTLLISSMVSAAPKSADFAKMVDVYFDDYFKHNPTAATAAGFHQYDSQLEDYSKREVDEQISIAKTWLERFRGFSSDSLSSDEAADRDLLTNSQEALLLELETVKSWEKNPDHYSSGLSASIFGLISRTFASPEARMKAVISREQQAGAVFAAARKNLKNPPQIFTEVALDQIPGIIGFFHDDVVTALKGVKDETLLKDFGIANQKVIELLKDYELFLREDVLPHSHGDFRLGKETYAKKLLYEEMVDVPLDHLLEIGEENLRANQELLKKTIAQIDPKRTFSEVFAEQAKDYPPPAELLDNVRSTLSGLKNFLVSHHIVTVPQPVLPIVEETPAFERALTLASMDTPGPYETKATEAYFNVTLPEKSWSPTQVDEHMAAFTHAIISNTAVHEAYPGHYIQFLWLKNVKSKVRKLIGCNSNAEGWAHYSEQMMLDEGYGKNDPKLRLGQILDALLRNARFMVGIKMHTGQLSYDQAIDYFVKEGYQTKTIGEREVKRGTSDPTYLYYTLGKLEILKLRADYKKKLGKKFKLQKFHDEFLKQGFPPIKIIRKAMLGDDSPTL